MSTAMKDAGLVTDEQVNHAHGLIGLKELDELKELIDEQRQLVAVLISRDVLFESSTHEVVSKCKDLRENGKVRESIEHMIDHFRSLAKENNITV